MTTLTLPDTLAERLTHIAEAQGKTLDILATETLWQLAEAAQPEEAQAAAPATLSDELMPFLQRAWAAQAATPARTEPYPAPGTFGDIYEERLSRFWDEDYAAGRERDL